ncbi:MAG TPA: translation initiation factor IF-3 [Candidatus Limnocylindrales bacterium]|nr:translation initiation factor IF-3 [Candidatus Limnocylindrales bacterium]
MDGRCPVPEGGAIVRRVAGASGIAARRVPAATTAPRGTSLSKDLRINEMIRVPQVRVVDEEGTQLGVLPTHEALRVAQDRGLDLVEVAPMAAPPVVRFLDYGQFKYEQARREKEARRHQRSVEFKEVRLSPKIGVGDFETKVRRAIQFLEAGDRIKVSCRFRGRELTHAYLGRDLLMRFADQVKEHGTVERQPLLEGKSMSIVITSLHKPKVDGARPADARPAGEAATDGPGPEAKAPAPEATGPAPEAKAPAPEAKAPAPEAKAPAPEAKAATPATATASASGDQ